MAVCALSRRRWRGCAWLAIQQRTLPAFCPRSCRRRFRRCASPWRARCRRGAGAAPGGALLEATGYVVARREATVGPKIAGRLKDVLVEEGMHVEEGQVIAHLDDSNARAALGQAKATFDQAQTTATDARPVFESERRPSSPRD